jgi:tetratricopeptide (TPR) repeat protein
MTSFRQKFLLVVFGLFLSAVILEVSLRMAGAVVFYLQQRHNHLSFSQHEYRILCLGESTTALGGEDSYPSQLEAMLNAQSAGKKFTVINKGIISTTSDHILAHIEQDLDMYKPRLVIVMMGINDRAYLHDFKKTLWWENFKSYAEDFRVYKLAHLIYEHVTHRIGEVNAPVEPVAASTYDGDHQYIENFLKLVIAHSIDKNHGQAGLACVELARRYRLQGSFEQAGQFLKEAAVLIPDQAAVYEELGELSLAQKQGAQAVKAFQVSITLNPKNSDALLGLAHAFHLEQKDDAFLIYAGYLQVKPQDYWGYIELARWLRENKHDEQAEDYLYRAIKVSPYLEDAYVDLGRVMDRLGQYRQEEALYLKEISSYPRNLRVYQALGQFYQKQGKTGLAKEVFQKAAGRQMPEYCPATLVNYSLLLDKILSRHIKVIVMQYPMRDIDPLKDYLGQRKGLVFVENKQNFKQALPDGGYWHYFQDNFAYDFGHCTRAGNELIARQLSELDLFHGKTAHLE